MARQQQRLSLGPFDGFHQMKCRERMAKRPFAAFSFVARSASSDVTKKGVHYEL